MFESYSIYNQYILINSDNCPRSQSLDTILYGEIIAPVSSGRKTFRSSVLKSPHSCCSPVTIMIYNYSWHLLFWLGHIYNARWQGETPFLVGTKMVCSIWITTKQSRYWHPRITAAWIFWLICLKDPSSSIVMLTLCIRGVPRSAQ